MADRINKIYFQHHEKINTEIRWGMNTVTKPWQPESLRHPYMCPTQSNRSMVLILHHAKKIKQYSDDVDDAAAAGD